MRCNVVVRNILTLSDGVDKRFLSFAIANSHKWDAWNGQGNTFFGLQYRVLVSNLPYDLIKIVSCTVGLCWCHFKHKTSILKHKGKIQIRVIFSDIRLGKLKTLVLIVLKKISLDFLSPLDLLYSQRFFPSSVLVKNFQELSNCDVFKDWLEFVTVFKGEDGAHI